MGYNTVLTVCNDQLSSIRNDPDFGRKVHDLIRDAGHFPGPRGHERSINQPLHGAYGVSALMPRHADDMQLVLVGRNTMELIGQCWTADPVEALKQVADQLGYKVIKQPERKKA